MGCLKLTYYEKESPLKVVYNAFEMSKKGGAGTYRYGYQGQFAEKDPETGWNAFELRMYDSRICRWMTPDPYRQYPSPYVAMGNNPVMRVDPDGGSDCDHPPCAGAAGPPTSSMTTLADVIFESVTPNIMPEVVVIGHKSVSGNNYTGGKGYDLVGNYKSWSNNIPKKEFEQEMGYVFYNNDFEYTNRYWQAPKSKRSPGYIDDPSSLLNYNAGPPSNAMEEAQGFMKIIENFSEMFDSYKPALQPREDTIHRGTTGAEIMKNGKPALIHDLPRTEKIY